MKVDLHAGHWRVSTPPPQAPVLRVVPHVKPFQTADLVISSAHFAKTDTLLAVHIDSEAGNMAFVINVEVRNPRARRFVLSGRKTIYRGKRIAAGDTVFIFANETHGGPGLIARGVVSCAATSARRRGIPRQSPRVSAVIDRTALTERRLGCDELKRITNWDDGRPESELNFKFYRQATNRIGAISTAAAAFLEAFFQRPPGRR